MRRCICGCGCGCDCDCHWGCHSRAAIGVAILWGWGGYSNPIRVAIAPTGCGALPASMDGGVVPAVRGRSLLLHAWVDQTGPGRAEPTPDHLPIILGQFASRDRRAGRPVIRDRPIRPGVHQELRIRPPLCRGQGCGADEEVSGVHREPRQVRRHVRLQRPGRGGERVRANPPRRRLSRCRAVAPARAPCAGLSESIPCSCRTGVGDVAWWSVSTACARSGNTGRHGRRPPDYPAGDRISGPTSGNRGF